MQLCAWSFQVKTNQQTGVWQNYENVQRQTERMCCLSLDVAESVIQSAQTRNATMQHVSKRSDSCANQGASQLISILILVTMNSMASLSAHDTKEDQLPGNHSEF